MRRQYGRSTRYRKRYARMYKTQKVNKLQQAESRIGLIERIFELFNRLMGGDDNDRR
jgi:hypothetical protein